MSIEGLPTGPRPDEISERSMRDFLAQAEKNLRVRGLGESVVEKFSKTFEEKFAEGYPAFLVKEGRRRIDDYIDTVLHQTRLALGQQVEPAIRGLLNLRAKKYGNRIAIMKEVAGKDTVAPFPSRGENVPEAPAGIEITPQSFKRMVRNIVEMSALFETSSQPSGRVGEMAEAEKRRAREDRLALIDTLEKGGDPYELVEERYGPIPSKQVSDALNYLNRIYDKLEDPELDRDEIAMLLGKLQRCLQSR